MALRERNPLRWALALAIVAGLAAASCKKEQAPLPPNDPIQAIIETQGLERLKKGSTWTARYKATLMGAEIEGSIKQKAGATRIEYVAPCGDPVQQVAADGKCWQKIGKAVLPCRKELAAHTTRLARLLEASWIWPLKEKKELKTTSAKINVASKEYDGVTVSAGGEELGTLLLDPQAGFVAGLKMKTTLGGKTGELIGYFTEHKKNCGVTFALKREYTFDGSPFMKEEIGGVICEAVDDKLFDQPEQVKHGTIQLKHKATVNLACTKHKGPYTEIGAALSKIETHLRTKKILEGGPAILVHRRGPPKVRNPKAFGTDVCLPVSKKAWLEPKQEWKGTFFLHEIMGDEVLAGWGVGSLTKVSTELPDLLAKDGKKRGRKQWGPAVQLLYMRPGDWPDEQRVSEVHIVLN